MNPHTIKTKGYKDYMVRVGAWIDKDDYTPIAMEFRHGQTNAFWRSVYASISQLIKDGKFTDVLLFIQGKKDLLLKVVKEK